MAIEHGNLRSLLVPNQTSSSCLGYCDPSCPYSCPDYLPTPPPPGLSPLSSPPPSSSAGDTSDNNHRFPPSVIIIVAFLGGAFLIVSYYVIISKSCLWYRSRRNRNRHPNNNNRSPSDQSDDRDDDSLDGTRIDHPIWYIRTIGLSQAVINSITVVKYEKSNGLIEGADCTVCLSEFQEGETLRLLPKCNHAFHVNCIDTWLGSHVNCPLCRADVVVTGHSMFDDSSMSRRSLEESQRNMDFSGNLSSREENQMEGTFVNNSNLVGSNSQARNNNSGVLGVIPERVNDGGETLSPDVDNGRNLKEGFVGSNGLTAGTIGVGVSDPVGSPVVGPVLSDVAVLISGDVEGTRLWGRSISLNSHSILSNSHMEEIRIDVDNGNGTVPGAMRSCVHQQLQNGDACASDGASGSGSGTRTSTTRSFSWSGRFFMHGIGRGAN